jgi:outer membrane protein OmpA-like peptidoglycan-associated protein
MNVVSFAEGSVNLSPTLDRQIAEIAARVKTKHYHVVDLTGYTDNVFTPAFNQTLNQNRAVAVESQLTADLVALHVVGVTVSIVTTPSAFVYVPIANVTAPDRAHNRRVVATLKAS